MAYHAAHNPKRWFDHYSGIRWARFTHSYKKTGLIIEPGCPEINLLQNYFFAGAAGAAFAAGSAFLSAQHAFLQSFLHSFLQSLLSSAFLQHALVSVFAGALSCADTTVV